MSPTDVIEALRCHRTIDITTTGAKSGRPHRIETWAWVDGDTVYLTGSPGRRDWYANLRREPGLHHAPEARRPGGRSGTGAADRRPRRAAADLRAAPPCPGRYLDRALSARRGRVLVGWPHERRGGDPDGPGRAEWWLRLVRVLTAPTSVFVWVRDDSAEAANAGQEPITAVVFLAGVSIFLSTRTAGRLFDDIEFDWLLVVVEAVVAGLLVAVQNFWVLGGAVYLGGRAADSAASYRQGRHVTGLATIALGARARLRLAGPAGDVRRGRLSERRLGPRPRRGRLPHDRRRPARLVGGARLPRRARAERLELGPLARGRARSPRSSSRCSCCCSSSF